MRTKAVFGLLLMLVMTACGDDSATSSSAVSTTAASAVSTTTSPAQSATPSLTLTVEGLVGSEGMAVVATLYTPDRYVGSVCIPVDADPWTGSGVFTSAPDTNPCEKNPPYGEVITEQGDFLISLGLYSSGATTPLVCTTATATIAGPSAVTVSADDLEPDC
jgi:hypothetical protein